VREELARERNRPATANDALPAVSAPPRDPQADLERREAIGQQIENYRAMGAITDTQMQELQAGIAQLDPASRKQMMSRLIRALNSGDIKGRL
jgi:hypothetical protein